MWVAKISFDGKNALIGSRTLKYKVNLYGFPLSYFYHKKYILVHITGILIGSEKNKRRFIKDLKKSKRLVDLEVNEDFFIGTIKEPLIAKSVYNKNIIHLSPAIIDENGDETLNIASFNKQELSKGIAILERVYNAEINYIRQKKVKNISIVKENPELTDKQKKALELAIKHGYYEYPRKIGLEKLAKLAGISYSTYQAHLRKAEQKLLPFFFKKSR